MSLIKCKDCNNEISDSAESCPKCGAPVPKVIGENEEQCPHCMTVVHESATTCPNCRAKKGYMDGGSSYGVMGKVGVIVWVVIFLVLTVGCIAEDAGFPALFFASLAFYFSYRVITGPRWYASKHAS